MYARKFFIGGMFMFLIFGCSKTKLNNVPVADAGPTVSILFPVDSVSLIGNGNDADGIITGYLWSKVSGPTIPSIHTPGQATTKITGLVAGTYYFQLMVIDDDGATGLDTVSVTVLPSVIKTLTLQPGPEEGLDALVYIRNGDNNSVNENIGTHPALVYMRWTWYANGFGEGSVRSYLKFAGLSTVPANAEILSAKLSLYGPSSDGFAPHGNSHYPGSPYYGYAPENMGWVQQVTANWNESTITWNNKPGTTITNRVALPTTTTLWNFNATDIDVTSMVNSIVSTNSNFGFCLLLQNEAIYRSVIFASSDATNAVLRPKLVVTYK
ncbi:MAG: DNRLRE domain-containing protein [Chitinophagaceae bacterium]